MVKNYVFLVLCLVLVTSQLGNAAKTKKTKRAVNYDTLTPQKLQTIANLDDDKMTHFRRYLKDILIVRQPDTEGNRIVRRHIQQHLEDLGWDVYLDDFYDNARGNMLNFVNIVATLNPQATKRLVLACHYDSKIFPTDANGNDFLGATDSAVPCAMMLDLAKLMDPYLKAGMAKQERKRVKENRCKARLEGQGENKKRKTCRKYGKDITLQLIFFDGEEAVEDWTSTDSLYGSRHLAEQMSMRNIPNGKMTELEAIDVLILLDLIGAKSPTFYDHYPQTSVHFQRMESIERRLSSGKLMGNMYNSAKPYFVGSRRRSGGFIQDDHIPFVQRGVKALHMISTPFPADWHKYSDNADIIDYDDVKYINQILRVYVAEHLGLDKFIKRKK